MGQFSALHRIKGMRCGKTCCVGLAHRVLVDVPVPVSEGSAGVEACWCLLRSRCSM